MHLVTYLSGRSPCLGAVWHDTVLDLRALSADMAAQRSARPARTAVLPATMLDVATLLATLAAGMTLERGDILATGTPSGVGVATGAYLKIGDVVEAEVDGLGVLTNPVVRPESAT